MTEIVEESVFLSDNTPREEDGKTPKTIRIAMFFDGTLNNRLNIAEREKGSSIYHEKHGDGDNSYDNGRTNIAIMEPHITGTTLSFHLFYKSYIEGQGTFDLEEDSGVGYAMGGGESGVVDRAAKGVDRMVELIDTNGGVNKKKDYIKKLTVDVFGFSRGAATARYAIHVLLHGDPKYDRYSLAGRLQELGYDIWDTAVDVRFAGLYDTVLSYWGTQYIAWTNLKQDAIRHVKKKVLHLAAADEHRKDFGLHNIDSVRGSGKGEEYYLPGAHSDVGGSYNLASEEKLKQETDEEKKVYMQASDEKKNINIGSLEDLEQDRQYLIAQGWGTEKEIKPPEVTVRTGNDNETYLLSLERKAVKSAYNNIPLKIMADYIKKDPVLLNVDGQLYDRATIILNSEADLQKLEERILNYIESKKKSQDSKDTDWIGVYADSPGNDTSDPGKRKLNPLNDSLMKKIRREHFHFSSKLGLGYNPHFEHDATLGYKRRTREVNDG